MTYVGELGWELMVPVEFAARCARPPAPRGRRTGVANAGYYAIESLRLEKGFRAFGRELTPDYTPVEAGLVFATALKGDKPFLGREALEEHRDRLRAGGPRRRLVSFVLEDPDPMLWGGELCSATASRPARSPAPPGGPRWGPGRAGVRPRRPAGDPAWLDGAPSRSTWRATGSPHR